MKLFLIAIFDNKAQEFTAPQGYPALGVAQRGFQDAVNNPESHLHKHPEDYSMHLLGHYDTESGTLHALKEGPQHLMNASQVLLQ